MNYQTDNLFIIQATIDYKNEIMSLYSTYQDLVDKLGLDKKIEEYFSENPENIKVYIVIELETSKIIGCFSIEFFENGYCRSDSGLIYEDYRRIGIGKLMRKFVKKEAVDKGYGIRKIKRKPALHIKKDKMEKGWVITEDKDDIILTIQHKDIDVDNEY